MFYLTSYRMSFLNDICSLELNLNITAVAILFLGTENAIKSSPYLQDSEALDRL
jgi:hypothetical protein